MSLRLNHSLVLVWLISLLSLSSLAQQNPASTLEKQFAGGVDALKAGDLETAEKTFLLILREGGKAPFVHHNLGIVYQQRGAHEKAVEQFRAASRLQPDYGPARLLAGVSLLALNQNTDAVRELERAVKLLPDEPQARLQLVRAYERMNQWPEVVEQYRALRALAPQEAEYAYQLGRAYNKLSEWSYQEIIRLNPNAARLHQGLGQNYLMQGKLELALRSYQQAAEADPKLPEIHLALALIHLEQKRFDAALKEIELELKLVPESKAALETRQKITAARASGQ